MCIHTAWHNLLKIQNHTLVCSGVGWFEPYLVTNPEDKFYPDLAYMGLVASKPVFLAGPGSIQPAWPQRQASLAILYFREPLTKVLSRQRGYAGWSAPLLFACNKNTHFLATRPIVSSCAICNMDVERPLHKTSGRHNCASSRK